MKKIIYLCSITLLLNNTFLLAQSQTFNLVSAEADINKGKTGNKEDLLTKYLQIAANNLTSNNKNLTLKLNWFALNNMDSAKKYDDANYLRSRWQRNGQFIFAGGMDKDSKFNSIQAGFNYNLLNLRDTTEFHYFNYYGKALKEIGIIKGKEMKNFISPITASLKVQLDKIIKDQYQKKENDQLKAEIYSAIKSFPNHPTIDELIKVAQKNLNTCIAESDAMGISNLSANLSDFTANLMLDKALNMYTLSFGKQSIAFDFFVDAELIKKIVTAIDTDIQNDQLLQNEYKAVSLTDADKKIQKQYRDLVDYVTRQPILTFGYNYTYGTGSVKPSHVLGLQGLWGLNKIGSKKTNELSISLSDTITNIQSAQITSVNRNIGAFQAGINTVLLMNNKISLMELNMAVENDLLFTKALAGESKNKFSFNSTFRVRLPNSPWLKFTVKYDVKKANFLGFLDFTYNIDSTNSPKS
ncbi:hypothetical protein [Mucilaginibacter sp. OK098]|uniref:hypothetical protein n=1 Tax=Mucilaginibacter sp. OK098 TaxID=1855297 RepID=UPI0009249A91|nr:hypothetical protein [Mucilaginibacter sp. OK098]SHN07453.1 hypothetical protein SAMN05216524_10540 [Mucilaginibacter sp. OK098]